MDPRLEQLQRLLELERLEDNLFRGESRDIGSPQVYGGQVLGQALKAAYLTVEPGRTAHSLHAYFLRRGDFNAPIVYFVDRSRDGHSFTSRRVTAIQHGEQIFHLSASFQVPQPGFEHQAVAPEVPAPELLSDGDVIDGALSARLTPRLRQYLLHERPFEFRLVPPRAPALAERMFWLRAIDRLADDDTLHRCLLAYLCDFQLLSTSVLPHEEALAGQRLVLASIDHAMWFHHPLRVDDWLLYVTDSPSASGSRGFARGSFYDRGGRLVASTAQEGLVRVLPPKD
ncbi:MAG: acyl-CoA thioesterase [Pseudomonadota bacterium]